MGWWIFFIISFISVIRLVPLTQWRHLWPSGAISMVFLYAIDSTLIGLGAFSYTPANPILSGIPALYWASSFFGGVLLAYYFPRNRKCQVVYVLLTALIFLLMELLMVWLGYMQYGKWHQVRSYFLDIFGFLGVLWIAHWLEAVGREAEKEANLS